MNSSEKSTLQVPDTQYISCGHTACAGCGERLALNFSLKGLGKRTILVVPACCSAVIDGLFPSSATRVPLVHNTFESTAAVASGVARALRFRKMEDVNVLAWAGDGGTYDIGLQSMSAAAERNENMIYICYDNEAYMNTGIQRSSATPFRAWTTTTPNQKPKLQPKKDIMGIMAAHYIPYAATASISFPEDLIAKVKKAKEIPGFKFILIFTPCPTGWRYNPEDTIKIGRLAVESRLFPLFEVEHGTRYRIKRDLPLAPVEEYLKLQKRFSGLNQGTLELIKEEIARNWKRLLKKEEMGD